MHTSLLWFAQVSTPWCCSKDALGDDQLGDDQLGDDQLGDDQLRGSQVATLITLVCILQGCLPS